MKLCVIVPVKPFVRAKSRLSPVLRRPLRATLARALLARTLDVLAEMQDLESAIRNPQSAIPLVVSRDLMALDLARSKGAQTILESGHDLNAALTEARAWAVQAGVEAVLTLPADLPWLTAQDICGLIDQVSGWPHVVIAPDRRERGTNALLLRPPDALHFAFGADSFGEHCAQAETSNVRLSIYRSLALAFDLDTPEDWAAIRDMQYAIGNT